MNDLREDLPRSLESDSLLVNSAWEAIALYDKNSELSSYFDYSLKCCADIGNAIVKQGITSMIWHSFISKKVAALANLIERVKKTKISYHNCISLKSIILFYLIRLEKRLKIACVAKMLEYLKKRWLSFSR